ncbi:hypothetical protein BJF79_08040 [Actinomadura sp. CNU-125]|nr:hypothetical protein BJF79_08040 [Actinomadura sp. CNU-125]
MAYHLGWQDVAGHPVTADGGKGIRARLVRLACEAVGGTAEQAVPAAVAVELAHNASLVHDDVIDGDELRRGRPAVWAVFGVPAAILAGDALFFLATEVLAERPPPLGGAGVCVLAGAIQQLIEGEHSDSEAEERPGGTLLEAEERAAAKTAALTAAAGALGALAAGAEADRIEGMRAYGLHLGLAFQFIDDLLGIWGDPARTGKPVGSDLASRKKSLPVVYALASPTPAGRALAELYETPRTSPATTSSGPPVWCRRRAAAAGRRRTPNTTSAWRWSTCGWSRRTTPPNRP